MNVLVCVAAPPPTAAADVTSSYTGVSADDGVGVSSSGRATAPVQSDNVVSFLFFLDVGDPLMLIKF